MGIAYAIVQCVAGCAGYGALIAVSPDGTFTNKDNNCMTLPHSGLSGLQAFLIEFLLTFTLVSGFCGLWDPRNKKYQDSTPIRNGFMVAALSMAGGAFTGASMNPARSLGPALWNWNWSYHWVYWAGPLSGGFAASFFYKYVFQRDLELEEETDRNSELMKVDRI
jgi:aquaporin related protein